MSILKKGLGHFFLEMGLHDEIPEWQKPKVRITNLLILIISGICLFFAGISYVFLKPILYLPVIAFFIVFFGGYILQFLKQYTYCRTLIISTPFYLSMIYNASISGSTHGPLPVMWGLSIAFAIPIFIIFDYRELKQIIYGISCMILFVFLFPLLDKNIDEAGIDYEFVDGYFFSVLCVFATFAVIIGTLIYQQILFKSAETKNTELIEGLEKQQQENIQNEKELEKVLQNLKIEKEKDIRRNEVIEGLSSLNTVIRTTDKKENLYDAILKYIVQWTKSQQGAIYTIDDKNKDKKFISKSTFAFGRKKFDQQEIDFREGLLGRCFLEKDKIILTEVPANAFKIQSGLGESTPSSIAIIPLKNNEDVVGIIEVSSLMLFDEHKIQFLNSLSEIIGSFIKDKLIDEQTESFIRLSKEQQEQLRSQEEELRQNMEELEVTQEQINRQMNEMSALNFEMAGRMAVLDESTILSESDLFGNITFVNQKFSDVSQFKKEELVGRAHNIVRHPDMPKEAFKMMWETIKGGKLFRAYVKNRRKDGSPYYVDAIIAPVYDENRKIKKYIGARYVIEDIGLAEKLLREQFQKLNITYTSTTGY